MGHFARKKIAELPPSGIKLVTHSVWNWHREMIPPATTMLCVLDATDVTPPLTFNVFNTTHGGVSGLHFDALFDM